MSTQTTTTAIQEAARRSREMFRAEVAARREGRQFDQLAALAASGGLSRELSDAVTNLAALTRINAGLDADRLAAARKADPELSARVAARRAARLRGDA